jgi:hypothetical protein
MKKQTLIALILTGTMVCISMTASADGLLGKHYLGAGFSSYNWGDSETDDALGRSNGGSVVGNFNLDENWDFNASYTGLSDSYTTGIATNSMNVDLEVHAFLAGLNYLFASDFPVTPYLGGAAGVVTVKDGSSTESDTAYAAKIGFEWDMCEAAFLNLAATFAYVDNNQPGNDGDYGISAVTGIKVIDHLMLVGGGSYIFEEENSTLTVGLVIVK